MESQFSKLLLNKDIMEEIIEQDEASGKVMRYMVV
jgi:hypothetical protein